jgi:hypothetical protein
LGAVALGWYHDAALFFRITISPENREEKPQIAQISQTLKARRIALNFTREKKSTAKIWFFFL